MDDTPLDVAHAAMQAAPEDDAARLRFYERIATAELYLLLTEEPEGEKISPRLFEADGATFVLVFDREERLGAFAQSTAPFAALPGRTLVGMIAAQGLGLGLNLDVAPSSFLMGAEAVDCLAATLDAALSGSAISGLSALTVTVPVAGLDCDNGIMNGKLRDALGSSPIRFRGVMITPSITGSVLKGADLSAADVPGGLAADNVLVPVDAFFDGAFQMPLRMPVHFQLRLVDAEL